MRTRSQPVSPGGFVSLDTDRAPRRKRTTTTATPSVSTTAKTEKNTPKQPAKKTTKRTRKTTTSRKKTSKKIESAGSDELQSTNEEETQPESLVSVVVQQPTKETTENTESEHPFPSFHPVATQGTPRTQEFSPQQSLLEPETRSQETPFTPVRHIIPEEIHTSIPGPTSASSIDTPSAGAALFAAAREAIYDLSPFASRLEDTQITPAHAFSAVTSPVTGPLSDVSRSSVSEQLTPTATPIDDHDTSVSGSSQAAHISIDPAHGASSPVDAEMSDAPSAQRHSRFWFPTVLSPIPEEPESSPAVSRSQHVTSQSSDSEDEERHSLVSSPVVDSPFTPMRAAALARPVSRLDHRTDIFPSSSPVNSPYTPMRAARPVSRLAHRADVFPSSSPQTPFHTPGDSQVSGYSVSAAAFSFSSSSPLSSPPENLLSPSVLQNISGTQSSATQTTPGLLRHYQPQNTHHGYFCQCRYCGSILQCPNGHPSGSSRSQDPGFPLHKALTKRVAPVRKRTRDNVSDDESTDVITPSNKRRNLGPPGSTPFARRSTPLSSRLINRATPFSEQRRRRVLEQQGRIDKTLFRLPQLIAQAESDRQVSKEPEVGPCEPSPLARQIDANKENKETEPDNQQPSTPETPRRGWGIRGLFSSVPRSFSRILPTFGLSPERAESSGIAAPASERISRMKTTLPVSSLSFDVTTTGQKSKEPSPHDLSYSLFPAPIDRNRYLQVRSDSRIDTKRRKLSNGKQVVVEHSGVSTTPEPAQDQLDTDVKDGEKKRKRPSISPDVIPNPPGSSYGLDLDYFTYSPEDEEETAEAQRKTPVPERRPVRGILRQRPPPKRVRFDTSPENTPSKLRLRATDAYTGQQFVGLPDPFAPRDNAAARPDAATTLTAVPVTQAAVERPAQRPPGFVPNQSGTFRLDYDAFSSDSEPSGEPSPVRPSLQEETEGPRPPAWTQPPPPRPTPAHAALPSTTEPAVDNHALAKVRSQAEKYKPKTPSGLRTASRYASPMGASPLGEVSGGDDDFARDAQWLLANCPSGDLSQLSWPRQGTLVESLGVNPEAGRLLAQLWEEREVEEGYGAFNRSLEEFAETLA